MNSKTLEMLQKYVGEEDNEELDNLGEKINIFGEEEINNQLYEKELIDKNDDINKLFEKINCLESNEINDKKSFEKIDDNSNNNSEENNNNKIINSNENQKFDLLYKIIMKKTSSDKLLYFNCWKNLTLNNQEKKTNKENEPILKNETKNDENNNVENLDKNIDMDNNNNKSYQKEELNNNNAENDNSLNEILQNNEENLEDHTQSEIITQHQNQLLSGDANHFHVNNSFTQIGDINLDNLFPQNKKLDETKPNNNKNTKNIFPLSLFNIINNKLYLYHKILFSCLKHKSIISNYYDKLYQLDKLNKKYEAILDEKSSIIINKTDEMEELKEKIEKLNKSLKEANKKNKNLNVIQESLCSKCGGSLEESFTCDVIAENQKIINEQNETIEIMKKEMNEIKSKYNLSEIKLKDLNNMKKEFENLSGTLLKPKIDKEIQTDDTLIPKQINMNSKNGTSNNNDTHNINIQIYNNNINNNNKNINISNTKKGSKKKNIPKKINFANSSNNYNMSISSGHNKSQKTDNNSNQNDNNSEINNEVLTSLRLDNSVLSNELLNLNREFNKLRNENKVISEKNIKLDKDKKDLVEKLKTKTEQCEKYKKENEEINRMINNTKYKNIINAETENKKLKNILEQNDSDIKKLKNMNEKCAKKILEQNNQIEKMKTVLGSLLSFKQQKEKLIVENKNYENEIIQLKNELNEEKNKNEKNEVLLDNKDKQIEKLDNEVKYYSFHIKKYKSDAERALEDAIGYQKIVRILEIQLNEYKEQLDKIKNNKEEEEG